MCCGIILSPGKQLLCQKGGQSGNISRICTIWKIHLDHSPLHALECMRMVLCTPCTRVSYFAGLQLNCLHTMLYAALTGGRDKKGETGGSCPLLIMVLHSSHFICNFSQDGGFRGEAVAKECYMYIKISVMDRVLITVLQFSL